MSTEIMRKLADAYKQVNEEKTNVKKNEESVDENQKAALAKKISKVSAPSAKGKAAVTLAPGDPTKKKNEKVMDPVGKADADIDNDGDVDKSDKYLHNRRKTIKKAMKKTDKAEVEMNPKLDKSKDKEVAPMENLKHEDWSKVWPIYKRIMEKAMKPTADKGGEHTKGATKSQAQDDLEAAQSNAQKMRKDHEPKIVDNPEASGDDVKKASNAGPSPKMRQGDNKAGDKKIINPAK